MTPEYETAIEDCAAHLEAQAVHETNIIIAAGFRAAASELRVFKHEKAKESFDMAGYANRVLHDMAAAQVRSAK